MDSISPGSTDLRWVGLNCENLRVEVYRWLTYQFTHLGVVHVVGNVFVLVMLGVPLEGYEGSVHTCLIFNMGVITGALVWFVLAAHGNLVGFSAGCFALLGQHYEDLIMNWRERHFQRMTLFFLLLLTAAEIASWATAVDLSDLDVSPACNFGGLLTGILLGSDVVRDRRVSHCEARLILLLGAFMLVVVGFCICWLFVNPFPVTVFEYMEGHSGYCFPVGDEASGR